jgi:anti-sigma factor (TIGR02949 family)
MQIDRYTCEHTFRLLDDFVDRELTPEEMRRVQEHLDICAVCLAEFRFEAQMIRAVRDRLQRISVPPGLRDRITAALQEARAEVESPQPYQSADAAG